MNENDLKVMFSSDKYDYGTPQEFFDKLDELFHFDIDLAASHWNAKCDKYYTIEDDSLSQDWYKDGKMGWLNPPYGRGVWKWFRKCSEEWYKGMKIVLLVPARTDTKYFHEWGFEAPYYLFIKGRLKFDESPDKRASSSAPFASVLVLFTELVKEQQRELSKLGVLLKRSYV